MISIKKLDGYFTVNYIVRNKAGNEIDSGTHKFGSLMGAIDSMEDLKRLLAKYL